MKKLFIWIVIPFLLGIQTAAAQEIRSDGAVRLTAPDFPDSDQNPAFSPDNNRIIFTRFHNGYNIGPAQLYLMGPSGENPVPLTPYEDQDNVNLPGSCWNAENQCIVFASDREETDDIWRISPDGSGFEKITQHSGAPFFIEPSWSSDGEWIVFEADNDKPDEQQQGSIWKVRADGTYLTVLTDGPGSGTDDRQPNWSPTGELILFQRHNPGDENWDIYTISPDGESLFQVTTDPSSDTDASWSPDGDYIVYSSDYGNLPVPNIFVISKDGGTPIRVTENTTDEDGAPSWSPDGEYIAFESHFGQEEDIPSALWRITAPDLPDTCTELGVTLDMPAHQFHPGDECFCKVRVCNTTGAPLDDIPVFVILDVYDNLYFAPDFSDFDYFKSTLPQGASEITVLPAFPWPENAGAASHIFWYAAMTTPEISELYGNMSSWEFGWSD